MRARAAVGVLGLVVLAGCGHGAPGPLVVAGRFGVALARGDVPVELATPALVARLGAAPASAPVGPGPAIALHAVTLSEASSRGVAAVVSVDVGPTREVIDVLVVRVDGRWRVADVRV